MKWQIFFYICNNIKVANSQFFILVNYPFKHPLTSSGLSLMAACTHEHLPIWSDYCLPFLPNQPWPPSAGSASWPCHGQIPTRVRVDDSGQEKPVASAFRGAWWCCQWLWPGILLHSLLVTQTTHKTLVRYKGLAFASLTIITESLRG